MGSGLGKLTSIAENEQVIIYGLKSRELINGPKLISYSALSKAKHFRIRELKLNQYALIEDEMYPERNRYVFGPSTIKLQSPYERIVCVDECPILDQDDYIVVCDATGYKKTVVGPGVYKPTYGEVWSSKQEALVVPVNHYIVLRDSNDNEMPIKHLRGPMKFVPEPFQTLVEKDGRVVIKCVEITDVEATRFPICAMILWFL